MFSQSHSKKSIQKQANTSCTWSRKYWKCKNHSRKKVLLTACSLLAHFPRNIRETRWSLLCLWSAGGVNVILQL
ncbi:hypothetical protein WN944_020314 [Citrus x changshan-huyou]|uniref:Uncharacterized protein n=1 Tax=Citrus x changshan-huyou TaxID=2935761 RepID=A0AAP0M386_9ROSI